MGTWVIREIESPKGYVLSKEEINVTIGEVDKVVEIELVNYFITGNIRTVNQFVFNGFSLVCRDIHDSCFLPCVLEVNRVLLIADKNLRSFISESMR